MTSQLALVFMGLLPMLAIGQESAAAFRSTVFVGGANIKWTSPAISSRVERICRSLAGPVAPEHRVTTRISPTNRST